MPKLPIESEATKIIKIYTGTNDYILYYKKMLRVNPYYVISHELAKYVIKNHNINPTMVNKWVDIHPYSANELKTFFKKEKTPDKIFINKVLAVKPKESIHVWGKMFEEENYYYSMFISTSAFTKIRQLPAIDWSKYKNRPPKKHQIPAIEKLVANPRFILADDMGLGKMEYIENQVFTTNGRCKIGDLKVGDQIIGSNGEPCNILGVYPQGIKDLYKITFNDGYSILVGKEHLWAVSSNNSGENSKNRKNRYLTLNVEQMLDENLVLEQKGTGWNEKRPYSFKTYYKQKNGDSKWQIPIVKPMQFDNNKELPIEPYLLGLCLGDGHFTKSSAIAIDLHQSDFDELFEDIILTEHKTGKNKRKAYINYHSSDIKELGLEDKHSDTKFIPDIYKYSSIENRLAILQGLMDTDGHCMKTKNGEFNGTEYCTVSERLADDVAEIVHSLGGIVRKKSKIGSYKKEDGTIVECKKAYRLNIKMPEQFNPFRLKRKADVYNIPTKYKIGRYIKNIEPAGQGEAVCIAVDAPDKLYVTEYAIVTHNTTSATIAALELNAQRILVICPATLKLNWKREILLYDPKASVEIINGNDWKNAKWVIVNYDILRNFHHMPQAGVKASDLPLTAIQIAQFDLVILDEAHKIKDAQSVRSKIINNFIFDIPNRWLLTGTPITNKPIDYFNLLQICESPLADNWQRYVKTYCDGKRFTNRSTGKKYWVAGGHSNLDELRNYTQNLILRRMKTEVEDLPDKIIRPVYLPLTSTVMYDRYMNEYEDWLIEMDEKGEAIPPWEHLTKLIKIRQMLSLDKINTTVEMAMDFIEEGKKVVIFSCFTETLDYLMEKLGNIAVRLDGSMALINRQKSVDAFQNSPKIKAFCANIIAGGVGITLTAGEVVIFNDLDWVPSNHVQAEDRCMRIGQKNNVNVFYPLFDETLDIIMFDALTTKKSVINQVMGDNEAAFSETMLKYVIERLNHQNMS